MHNVRFDMKQSRGGGGVLPYVCILGMCRALRLPFSALNEFVLGFGGINNLASRGGGGGYFHMYTYWVAYHFHKLPTNSVPEHHHFKIFGGFCRSRDHHFQNVFNFNPFIASHGRLSPNAKRSAAPRVSGRSADSHFHAQNGSSSFGSPTFSRSTGSSFRNPCPFFTSPRHIPTKIWGEYPPPPPPGNGI